jgi:hypothetical protein
MLTAFAAWRLGVQDRLILTGVQVPPSPLGLMIVQLAGRSALRAWPVNHLVVPEVNVDLAGLQFQVN